MYARTVDWKEGKRIQEKQQGTRQKNSQEYKEAITQGKMHKQQQGTRQKRMEEKERGAEYKRTQ